MSEHQPKHYYYEGTDPCPLAGTERCCRKRHDIDVETRVKQGTKTVERLRSGKKETIEVTWQPIHTRLFPGLGGYWLTPLEYDRPLMLELVKEAAARPDRHGMTRVLDISSNITGVHTEAEHDCPLRKLIREHKT